MEFELVKEKLSRFPELGACRESVLGLISSGGCTPELLQEMFLALKHDRPSWTGGPLGFEDAGNETAALQILESTALLSRDRLMKLVVSVADLTSEVLPLGTVVSLKKEHLGRIINVSRIESARFIITNRFLPMPGGELWYPYAGHVYPFGPDGTGNPIYFTGTLIEEVVHMGYRDEQDEAYVLAMKRELIVERNMHSVTFSTGEEREKIFSAMKPKTA